METFILALVLGVVCIVIGVFNWFGHLGTLKRKHKKRVAEEDLPIFAKWIGAGTIIIGIALTLYGVFQALFYHTANAVYDQVGTGIFIVGLVIGGGMGAYAMLKYNKGIF